ncbi:hypothetical protein GGS23DRAFT_593387 [Durotheca rogersii]|uniref:uncharacterized protein n=1 Tax=Durotheca rogersii TaxID=419775 RepID=UPI00221FAAFB|nr:uncharacterized protein GGS23DRAFT_593387 [Durotheca rogersii]KAI5866646.1 hypothetical protein GGS23DRAFT_593387 [Durotheca rogersii]
MATSSVAATAPWRQLFLEHVRAMPAPEFTLGTVRKVRSPSSAGAVEHVPRARTCVFRGLWGELSAAAAEPNPPDVYEGSDLLTFTTDRRSAKVADLFGAEAEAEADGGEGSRAPRLDGSGGGAPVEAVFWVVAARTQWRVRGRAYVLAPGAEDGGEEGRQAAALIRARMRRRGAGDEVSWSFDREIAAHFGNLSPLMRGTFRGPAPGRPVAAAVEGPGLGQRIDDLEDVAARANFRVVVVVPHEVDRCDLSDPERGRRWLYRLVGGEEGEGEGKWEEFEVWP